MNSLDLSDSDQEISDADKELLYKVAKAMVARRVEQDNHNIPAGYTYLGQFIAHDLTFHDTRGTHFSSDYEPLTNVSGNTVLDLRSMYAGGPMASPLLYEFAEHGKPQFRLRLSNPTPTRDVFPTGRQDLQRLVVCPFLGSQGGCNHNASALVGDPRNDENLLISQLTVLFCRVHNRIAEELDLRGDVKKPFRIFDLAKRLNTQCYRKIVLRDFLERLLHKDEHWRLLSIYESKDFEGFEFLDGLDVEKGFTAPKEFSFSAFRFGHAMVRDRYAISQKFDVGESLTSLIKIVSNQDGKFPITEGWVVDWRRFFFNENELSLDRNTLSDGTMVNYSNRLTASAPSLLGHEADFLWPGDDGNHGVVYRDLVRSKAERVHSSTIVSGMAPLAAHLTATLRSQEVVDRLRLNNEAASELTDAEIARLARNCPLYLYVLVEAELAGGDRLGLLGSRIVGETIVGAIMTDPNYMRHGHEAEQLWQKLFSQEMPGDMVALRDFDAEESVNS